MLIKKETIRNNREILKSIVEYIMFLGRNNLAFRGQKDVYNFHAEVGEQPTDSFGLFQNLLNFRVLCGVDVLKRHLQSCPKNSRYTTAPVQNELIEACGRVLTKKVVSEVNHSGVFSGMADESRDCANKEQLAIVVRYVDTNSEAKEKILKFVECDQGVTGADIRDKIVDTLKVVVIDMNLCRGQGYDGRGNMAGIHKEAAARITLKYPLSLYCHCSCHRLNLCVQRTCEMSWIK